MKITVDLDNDLLDRAARLSGINNKDALVRLALETLVSRESARRLARLGGTEMNIKAIPRRRA